MIERVDGRLESFPDAIECPPSGLIELIALDEFRLG